MLPFLAGLGMRQWVTSHVTALMWTAAFGVSVLIAFWDQMPKRRRLSEAVTTSSQRLKILSAVYGTDQTNDIDVTKILQSLPHEAITFLVSNNLFGHDPAEGFRKRLKVEYSYGNPTVVKIERPEGSRVTIPEDSHLKGEIQRLGIAARHEKQSSARQETDAPNKEPEPPVLLLRFVRSSPSQTERLVFINDGPAAIVEPKIGPLKWRDHREIGMLGNVGTIEARHREEHDIWIVETAPGGTSRQLFSLYEFMRTRTPHDAETVVTVTYGDANNRTFSRDFMLTTQIDGGITWTPGPVRRV